MAWTDSIPAVGNKISVSIPTIEANFAWLKTILNNDFKDWTSTGIGKSACYFPDPAETDQGVTATGSSNTVFDLVATIGSTKKALMYFRHAAADGDTTTYQFKTDLNVPKNITVYCEPGAIIKTNYGICDGGGTYDWTLHSGSIYKLDNTIVRPTKLYESGTEVTEVADVVSITGAGKWAWYGNTVYIWTTGSVDPDTLASNVLLVLVTVEIQHTQEILVDWFGAVPDGDAGTSSGLPMLAAILAAANGSIVQFFGDYYNEGKTLNLGSSKFITVQGPATIYYGGIGRLFEIKGGVSATKIKHTVQDLNLYPSAGNERSAATQTAVYLEGTTFCRFINIGVEDFYVGFWQHNTATQWSEMNEYRHCKARNVVYGQYLDTAGNKSMGTCIWDHFSTSVVENGVGFYQGPNVSLYRAKFHMVHFPRAAGAIGVSFNGTGKDIAGQIHVEGASSTVRPTDNIGIYFGETSKSIAGFIISNIIGCAKPYDKHVSASIPRGFYTGSKGIGLTAMTFAGSLNNVSGIMETDYLVSHAIEAMTSANPVKVKITAHGLNTGDDVQFFGITQGNDLDPPQWSDLNMDAYEVTHYDADNFTIDYDARTYTAYDEEDPGKARFGLVREAKVITSGGDISSYFHGAVNFIEKQTGDGAEFHAWLMADKMYGTAGGAAGPETLATESVKGVNTYITNNKDAIGEVTITKFLDGIDGQFLFVKFGVDDDNTTIESGGSTADSIRLWGGQDYLGTPFDMLLLWYDGVTGKWTQVGGSTVKKQSGTFSAVPARPNVNDSFMCTNEGVVSVTKPIFWQGSKWILADGTDAAT